MEEETEYLFVSLEGLRHAHEELAKEDELVLENLLSEEPSITLGGMTFAAVYDEDIGSTMYFDRAALDRVAETAQREVRELRIYPNDEKPLVAVTSKRLRLK